MEKVFKKICKKCNGKCCRLNIMITRKDKVKLGRKFDENSFKKYGKNIYVHWKNCPFLISDKGCTLSQKSKPFDCRLFPLTFMYQKGKIKIFLNKKCPYVEEIPQIWISKRKKWLINELRSWTKEELKTYTSLIKKHSSSELTRLN